MSWAYLYQTKIRRLPRDSASIHAIFKRYSDLVEGVALDEAYLDVTENKHNSRKQTQVIQLPLFQNAGIIF